LKHLHQVKADELNRLKNELEMVNEDCKKVNDNLLKLKTTKNPENEDNSSFTTSSSPTTIISNKKRTKVHCHFDELSQSYIQSYNRDLTLKEFNIKDCTKNSSIILDKIRETVNKITNCNEMKCIASVNYNTSDTYSLSNIVSAVDFDCSYEHFALAGVTKRIKIYDFGNILSKPNNIHYPQYEMTHLAKLSCISWNKYFKQQIVCSDYEGAVTLWDSEQGTLIRSYQEHDKRCWGVQFCSVDPRLIASASDDTKVKIWSTNSEYSLISLDAKSNVCCVVFKPDSKFHVLFGTADHSIHYYDLRMAKEPVSLFKGHRKAVSYVKFCSETGDEFVSASTDSLLKSWKLNENYCMRSYTGHLNEKNFVGLDSKNGYIVTGSENNNLYLYTNELSKPLLNYRFDESKLYKRILNYIIKIKICVYMYIYR
jgi:E3 ubiquitin-protein ligase RFWD2